ncbi:50S ribosomal protein L7ae [Inconstantimicrobium mannanitabidum]|uniref:Lipoprotein n=1 Tax=Inconstantimicrobium mannanitabidum TaxID=1604901 RepID=A0ACB5RA02_9CLOT|nr:50S ribosomal protein L7ae [Clostridium sp. TW13]GKX65854.1 lipoprotein [Clostridium sp. TW13]
MTSKKRIIFITMTIMIISLLSGCSNKAMNKIYDDNSKIASAYDTFGLSHSKETIEPGIYKARFKLSGSGTIWTYESDSDIDLKVPYILSVKSGKAKIVLISPDNTVVTLVENTNKATMNETTSFTVPIKKGNNRIKIVGCEKADIDIELHIEQGTFKEINEKIDSLPN